HLLTPADTVMLYLLPIMAVAFRYGQKPSLSASALSVAAYDFFFVQPYYTFSVAEPQHILTFAILFGVGLLISGLMARIRRQEQNARDREAQTDALHHLSREMMSIREVDTASRIITRQAQAIFGGEAALYLEGTGGERLLASACPETFRPDALSEQTMSWSGRHGRAAGRGTVNQPGGEITCLPLATSRTLGVLALRIAEQRFFDVDYSHFLESFARQASLAIDRARLSEEAGAIAIRAKAEELRSALLSMASHDLRTPLAAITGAGTTLRDDRGALDETQRIELLETLCSEAERMERLIANLLDMVRLESGGCHLRREWVPFEELVGSALARLEKRCQDRPISVQVDESAAMGHVDPIFFEQVLLNLLDNAIKYTPPGSPIFLEVTGGTEEVNIRVMDQGPGLPPGEEARLFEKFTRGNTSGIPGSGLGLAICQGVVLAHGGTIRAGNREAGGAEFHIVLPQPPLPAEWLLVEQGGVPAPDIGE
ncbi:MAG: DUF4118 domain-containing protein, partial [Magnetococcales bacterium]|nr:DUF4118 domain-containing protein [Magnetococcales bacterium]